METNPENQGRLSRCGRYRTRPESRNKNIRNFLKRIREPRPSLRVWKTNRSYVPAKVNRGWWQSVSAKEHDVRIRAEQLGINIIATYRDNRGGYRLISMTAIRHLLLALLLSLVPLTTACDDSDETISSTDLGSTDREFWSTAVTQDGSPRELIEGTRITLRFRNGNLSASAGCNFIRGPFELDGDTLVAAELVMTEIGCNPELHAQDDLLAALLTDAPTVALDGNRLTLITTDLYIEFLDRRVANPDRTLIGTQWAVTGFLDGETASAFAIDKAGWFRFDGASTIVGHDGCAPFTVNVEVSEGEVGGPIEGDAELQFGPVVDGLDPTCNVNADYAEAFRALFDTGAAVVDIEGDRLTILNSDGRGVTARAVE